MKELIRHILKEETSDFKKPFMKYDKLINMLVYEVFDEGICGLSWDVIKLYYREGISIRIVLHFTEDSFRDFDYERYGQSKQELKNFIENYLPKFDGIYIAYDTTKCGKENIYLKESENEKLDYKSLIEEIVEPFKDDECICDINVIYDEEEDMYSVYAVTSMEKLANKFDNLADLMAIYVKRIRNKIKKDINAFLPIENIYVGSLGKPNCDWDPVRRIDEDYNPAGKEVTPNEIVVHKSNPMFRDKIMSQGLKTRAGECYKIYVGYGEKCIPAIFATNSTNKRAWFDSTYDDDIWFIDTTKIPDVKWFKDKHFESTKKHIVTFQDIPKEAITLKYEGTGSGDVKTWNKKSPNLFENKDKDLSKKIKLAKALIYDFFGDEVSFIEQSTYDNKPLLKIYFKTDDEAANHSTWLAEKIIEVVMEYTGNNLILAPWYTFDWDIRKELADIYIGCEELKTDEDGNELNEIELTERCWKGYTQKGMKTMFGKRYPNCVKKRKK